MLAYTQVRIGSFNYILHTARDSGELSRNGLATLKELAGEDQASATILDQAADAFLTAEPASLRDLRFAVSCAEREVGMSHARMPFRLLTLAQAYRATAQTEKGPLTGNEVLAPPPD